MTRAAKFSRFFGAWRLNNIYCGAGVLRPPAEIACLAGKWSNRLTGGNVIKVRIAPAFSLSKGSSTSTPRTAIIRLFLDKAYALSAFVLWNDLNVQVDMGNVHGILMGQAAPSVSLVHTETTTLFKLFIPNGLVINDQLSLGFTDDSGRTNRIIYELKIPVGQRHLCWMPAHNSSAVIILLCRENQIPI